MKTRKLQWLLATMMFAMVVLILGGCDKDEKLDIHVLTPLEGFPMTGTRVGVYTSSDFTTFDLETDPVGNSGGAAAHDYYLEIAFAGVADDFWKINKETEVLEWHSRGIDIVQSGVYYAKTSTSDWPDDWVYRKFRVIGFERDDFDNITGVTVETDVLHLSNCKRFR